MKRLLIAILLATALYGCASNTPLPAATVQPTTAPVLLADIDLQKFLFEQGDLPASLAPGQIRDFAPEMFHAIPEAQNTAFLQFNKTNGDTAGGMTIFLYDDQIKRDTAYLMITKGFGDIAKPVSSVGEKATGADVFGSVELVFQDCSAVIHMRMIDVSDMDAAVSYGRRLIDRLSPLICSE